MMSINSRNSIVLSPHRQPPCNRSLHATRLHAKDAANKLEEPVTSKSDALSKDSQSGTIDLVLVSFLWGTYNPVMKLIYDDDVNMDPSTLTAIRTVLSALALGTAVLVEQSSKKEAEQGEIEPPVAVALTATTEDRAEGILTWTSSSVMIAGIELGIYNFLGTSLQAQGIQLTSATRAGFLSQLAAVLTPALSVLIGEKISLKVWLAICLGLLGSCLVALDSIDGSSVLSELSIEDSKELQGAAFLLSACLFYSLATVRLGLVAQKFSSVNLAAWKKLTLGGTSLLWFFSTPHEGSGLLDWLDHRSIPSILLILYSALGSGALGTFLQTRGQRSVSATRAQVLYGLVPIWSALAAYLVFGNSEGAGPFTWVGGGLVLTAGILASQRREGS